MGCWNGTCMISNLSISFGEKIKLVLLNRNQMSYKHHGVYSCSGYTYSTDILCPVFLPISGEYDDYGSIENIVKDWNTELIEDFIQKNYSCGLDKLLKSIRSSQEKEKITYIDYNEEKKLDWSYVLIRQDVWNECVKLSGVLQHCDWSSDKLTNFEFVNKEFDEFEKINKLPIPDFSVDDMKDYTAHSVRKTDEFVFKEEFNNAWMPSSISYRALAVRNKDNLFFMDNVRKQWLEFLLIEFFLSHARKGWIVQPGSGSQDDNLALHIKFSKAVINICKKRIKQQREE